MAWQLELHNVGQASRLSAGWDVRYFGSAGARHSVRAETGETPVL